MTEQQQQIVDSLIAEFNRINIPRPNGFARIGEALDKCDQWATLVAGIAASNARYEYLREETIETDYNRLVEECRLGGLNLRFFVGDDYIKIDTSSSYWTDNAITIYYKFASKSHRSSTGKSIDEFTSIRLYSYQASTYAVDFATIDSLFLDDVFFKKWTKLIELSRK
jgi:hypothetical protein